MATRSARHHQPDGGGRLDSLFLLRFPLASHDNGRWLVWISPAEDFCLFSFLFFSSFVVRFLSCFFRQIPTSTMATAARGRRHLSSFLFFSLLGLFVFPPPFVTFVLQRTAPSSFPYFSSSVSRLLQHASLPHAVGGAGLFLRNPSTFSSHTGDRQTPADLAPHASERYPGTQKLLNSSGETRKALVMYPEPTTLSR